MEDISFGAACFPGCTGQNVTEWNFGPTHSEMKIYIRCVMLCSDAQLCFISEAHKKCSPALLQVRFISQPLISGLRRAANQRGQKR